MIRLINRYLKTILKLIIAIGMGCVCLYIGYHEPRKSIQLYSLNITQNSTLLNRDGPTSSAKPYWNKTPTSTLANNKESRKTRENTNIFLEKNASLIQPINNQDANPKHSDRNSTDEKFGDKWTLAGKVWESADFKMKYTFNNIASDLMKDLLNFDYTGLNNFYPIHCDFIDTMTNSKQRIASSTNKKVYIVKYTGETIRHINFFGDISHNSRFDLKSLMLEDILIVLCIDNAKKY
ncbi:unnamed protein product [Owenia fusiformis]|uniref:Uncharacterized protein n=1 Tax=Owenia fusiformis TaxID=6347 RepID=A0A8J1XT41_OWEFU|nr:unnamed protein product [Owenia fusiformis]